ncbi:hypothetical protein [Cohnella algarum]|uniref:hypothetical protein n=1 Tax=Cohnella algarum TaxID=2044859 RepID=UPI00196809F7|nr:hypothetical protein [Cohnella algarum]MBN2981624.1 hypothetical protein [Cohnella algarum]
MEMRQAINGLAVIAILGGVARIGMAPSAYIWGSNSMQELTFGFVASLLMGIGILGIYLNAAPNVGIVGFLSTLVISAGGALTVALVWSNMLGMTEPDHAYIAPLLNANSILSLAGQLVFGIVMIRARAYPLWSLLLFMVFPFIYFIPGISDLGSVAWGACYIAFGYCALKNQKRAAAPHSSGGLPPGNAAPAAQTNAPRASARPLPDAKGPPPQGRGPHSFI